MIARPIMRLNGHDVYAYNIYPLEGTISTIITPPTYKKLVTNENSHMHGSMVLSSPNTRRLSSHSMSLSFFMHALSPTDLQRQVTDLQTKLVNGMQNPSDETYSGVNELYLPEYNMCLRLVFEEMTKCSPWFPHGDAVITLKFTEPNPNNRSL